MVERVEEEGVEGVDAEVRGRSLRVGDWEGEVALLMLSYLTWHPLRLHGCGLSTSFPNGMLLIVIGTESCLRADCISCRLISAPRAMAQAAAETMDCGGMGA